MPDSVTVHLISPASTPGCETAPQVRPPPPKATALRDAWPGSLLSHVPVFTVVVSVLQVVTHTASTPGWTRALRLDPQARWQAWRYLTYMLAHGDGAHLGLNVALQCLLATPLEREQGSVRAAGVYAAGGVFGAVGASLIKPQLMVGASAGVYALLSSHLVHLYLNYAQLKYKLYRIFSVLVLAGSDVAFYVRQKAYEGVERGAPTISVAAHASGAAAGMVVGLAVYQILEGSTNAAKHRHIGVMAARVVAIMAAAAALGLLAALPDTYFHQED